MWRVLFTDDGEKDFKKLEFTIKARILTKLKWLAENFDLVNKFTLKGLGLGLKLRVGDFRIIYKVDYNKSLVMVCVINRRDKVYKKLK